MGKNKHSDDNCAYLLYKNKQLKIVNINEIPNYLAEYDIVNVLIPVKKFNSYNYIMLNPEFLYHKIGTLEVHGLLAIQGFCYDTDSNNDGNGIYEIIRDFHLSADTLSGICSVLESLLVLNYSNSIVNPEYSDEYFLFALDNVSITMITNKERIISTKDNKTCMDKRHSSDDYGSVSVVIDRVSNVITNAITGRVNDKSYSAFVDYNHSHIYINGTSYSFNEKDKYNSSVIGVLQPTVGTYTFMNYYTYNILDAFVSSTSTFQTYIYIHHANSEIENNADFVMSYKYFDDYPDIFEMIWDYTYQIYSTDHLIELLSNFKHVASAVKIFTKTIFGDIVDDILFNIVVYVDTTKIPNIRTKKKHVEYVYEVTYSQLEEKGDILNDMIITFFETFTE